MQKESREPTHSYFPRNKRSFEELETLCAELLGREVWKEEEVVEEGQLLVALLRALNSAR